jgi:hypothetical protein
MSHDRHELRSRQAFSTLQRSRAIISLCATLAVAGMTASCAKDIDVKQALQVTDVTTGWFDAGVVDGKNKLVPSISFRLRSNTPDLASVALNIAFKFVDNGEINE